MVEDAVDEHLAGHLTTALVNVSAARLLELSHRTGADPAGLLQMIALDTARGDGS